MFTHVHRMILPTIVRPLDPVSSHPTPVLCCCCRLSLTDFIELAFLRLQGGGITMRRGLSYKGKNGPGLTNVRRVLTTRERVEGSHEPCKVRKCAASAPRCACVSATMLHHFSLVLPPASKDRLERTSWHPGGTLPLES